MTDIAQRRDIAERFSTGGWEFTPEVVAVFDEHVRASVPHYDVIQNQVAAAADWLLPEHGTYVDLGASTGTTAELITSRHPDRQPTVWLYDEQPDMLARATGKLSDTLGDRLHTITTRIQDGPYPHHNADLTTALFTLQFLPFHDRITALTLAREHAAPSGALLIAEKVIPTDARWAEIANDLSHDWKAEHGISDTAIRAKARALRGVLRPATAAALTTAVTTAGWTTPETLFRWHSWALLGAFATPGSTL